MHPDELKLAQQLSDTITNKKYMPLGPAGSHSVLDLFPKLVAEVKQQKENKEIAECALRLAVFEMGSPRTAFSYLNEAVEKIAKEQQL